MSAAPKLSPVREKPILFSGPMVRAILEGTKRQTRRVLNPQPAPNDAGWYPSPLHPRALHYASERHLRKGLPIDFCPYGQPGDRLWVRETWGPCAGGVVYRASEDPTACPDGGKWKPSIFMPRWASRLTLEVTEVRVERLQEISEEDAKAEGALFHDGGGIGHSGWRHDPNHGFVYPSARSSFAGLWDSINADRAPWASNPWVWVVGFRRVQP
jgi:hypothetical protein